MIALLKLMRLCMFKHFETFLKDHILSDKPVLFGYSGGVDSTCLFYLLKMYKKHVGLNLHVIHVDHGWRSSSLDEALALKKEVDLLNIPFYLETITTVDPNKEKNLEEKYRNERIKIFKRYYVALEAQALLLAHQKEDQAETVFKRVFEGASFFKLIGLKQSSFVDEMRILRPLLPFSKKQFYELAEKEGLSFIKDETNFNPKYLRARQRVSIFPEIEKQFGKNSIDNLSKLGKSIHRYEEYISKRLLRYEALIIEGPFGFYINLGELYPLEPLELEWFIRKTCERCHQSISYESLEMLVDKVLKKASNKRLKLQNFEVIVDRDHLFFVRFLEKWSKEIYVDRLPYSIENQGYLWKINEVSYSDKGSDWKDFWKGSVEFAACMDAFYLTPVDYFFRVNHKSLKDLYSENKIPAFLRDKVPNIFEQGRFVCNPLINLSFKDEKDKRKFRLSVEVIDKKKNFF